MPPRVEQGAHAAAGWWGPPTSSVNWCELDYDVTELIAECANTVSSLAILLVGLVGLALHWRTMELRFSAAFGAIALVGAGSVGFHMTLRREWQMMDEVPMLWSALAMTFILLEDGGRQRRYGRWLPWALCAHGAVITALTALSEGELQFALFHASFGTLEFFSLHRVWRLWQRAEREERSQPTRQRCELYRRGFGCYGVGLVCWATDLLCCEQLRSALPANPQLHAWWHVFVSGGLYTLSILVAHARAESLHQSPQIRHLGGWLPYVHTVPLEVHGRRMRLHEPPAGSAQGAQGARSRSRSPSPSRAKRK